MLKRVGLIGDTGELLSALQAAAEGRDLEIRTVNPGEGIDASITAVVAGSADGAGALSAADTVGARFETMLLLLGQAIECRESGLLSGPRRMLIVTGFFADALSLTPDEKLTLQKGALVHDIGKLTISNDVLLKRNLLSHDDWQTLRQHTTLGAEMVSEIEFLTDTRDIVHRHHECYDGTGYPDGLNGDAIPMPAQLMKILDVYCAMTSPRHYRSNVGSHDDAVAYLREEKGKRFHPGYVETFLDSGAGRVQLG